LGRFLFGRRLGVAVEDEPGCVEREIMCSKNEAALVCKLKIG
jgi:hypothetical protein